MTSLPTAPETLHPALWRASQLARGSVRTLDTGYPALSAELPGQGWPIGQLIELLAVRPGLGELRLLRPALLAAASRPVVFLAPPHLPHATALAGWGLPPERLLWLRPQHPAHACWAAEQILRAGTCGALLFWHTRMRSDQLRRLHLAAQSGETLFCLMRPADAARTASPAPLRLQLDSTAQGLAILFLKRRGPPRDTPLSLALQPLPILRHRHVTPVDLPAPAPLAAGSLPAALVS
ncbi:translesion DNA synthesis-associated protein ImuA [Imbroritus primus]|uniref:Translesion DNA synthesis-associated protein ImuA n=1 Tax=Imbroritus primus TaxID=3058603 RepID=A0ACD3SK98_9BURK|nr:translesion DNA synthesis-associated protein ImuA [Burkholderiaceae bacterium PBA]